MKTAEDIVRALAAYDVLKDPPEGGRYAWCGLCGTCRKDGKLDHDVDCPYRMALEWVAEQGRIETQYRRDLNAWIQRTNERLTPKS